MSNEESRKKISEKDLQMVQNLIEQCLQHYMTPKEVVNILAVEEKIEPGFTELVWKKLEEENQEFFKGYYLRLMLKEQIMEFNRLLGRQAEMMPHVDMAGVSFLPPKGCDMPPRNQYSACYAAENTVSALKTENTQQPISNNIPNDFSSCGVSIPSCMQTAIDMPDQARGICISPNMLVAQGSNMGMVQVTNGEMVKPEATGYPSTSPFIYGAQGIETHAAIGDASFESFSSVELNSQPLNETLMDADNASFGLLEHLSQNFTLSGLTPHFSHDILESYSRPVFTGSDTGNYIDSHGQGDNQGDARRLKTISEGLRLEDFCSD